MYAFMLAGLLVAGPSQDSATAVWSRVCAKLNAAKSVHGTLYVNPSKANTKFTMVLAKPASFFVQSDSQGFASDGKASWLWFTGEKTFRKFPVEGDQSVPIVAFGWQGFYQNPVKRYEAFEVAKAKYGERDCQKLTLRIPGSDSMHWVVYVGDDDLPLGWEQRASDVKDSLIEARYEDVKLDQPTAGTNFDWTPPSDYQEKKMGADLPMLPVGSAAPNFEVQTVEGKSFKLSDALKTSKLVMLNFWFIGCAPCRAEFPYIESLYKSQKGKGLTLLTVDRGDDAASIRKFLADSKYSFPAIIGDGKDGVIAKYKVGLFPTTYLIDPSGKIVDVILGNNVPQLVAGLKKAGLNPPPVKD